MGLSRAEEILLLGEAMMFSAYDQPYSRAKRSPPARTGNKKTRGTKRTARKLNKARRRSAATNKRK